MTSIIERIRLPRWLSASEWAWLLPAHRWARLCLAASLLVAFALDFLYFTGFFASDDAAYLFGSRQLAEGGQLTAGMASARLAITVPDAVVYWLSDGSIAAIAWFHVVYHLGLVAIAFHLGRLVADERVGLLAAALTAVQPLLYVYAGAVLPDNAMAFWLGLLLIVLEVARQRREQASAAEKARWYALAGLLIGVAYSCKESALVVTIPAAVCVIAAAPRLRSVDWIRNGACMAAGLAAFVAVEAVALWLLSGELQWRLGFIEATGDRLREVLARQGRTPWDRFAYAAEAVSVHGAISMWALVAASSVYAFSRRRNVMLLAFFWWIALYLTIGTTSFTEYRPQSIQGRYYAVALLPALVTLAIVLMWLHDRWGSLQRVPGRLRGRARVVFLGLVVAAVAIHEAAVNASRAGNIYWAPLARGYADALAIARDDYGQYPVIAETFYRTRMRPLLFPEPPEWFRVRGSLDHNVPAPPFIYLERTHVAKQREEGRHGGSLLWSQHGPLRVRTLRMHYPPESRLETVRDGVRRLLTVRPGGQVPPPSIRGGTVLQLVTVEHPPARHPELFGFDDDAAIEPLEDGVHFVSWGDPRRSRRVPSRPPTFYVQTFDSGSYLRPPPDESSGRLAEPVSSIAVDAGYRLIRGGRVRLEIYLYGYDAAGEFVQGQAEIEARPEQDRVMAHVEVSSAAGLVAYKLRTKVIARRKRGGLQVFPPVVRGHVALAPR